MMSVTVTRSQRQVSTKKVGQIMTLEIKFVVHVVHVGVSWKNRQERIFYVKKNICFTVKQDKFKELKEVSD